MTHRVAAFTAGRSVPSARFRVRQLIAPLALQGYRVREFPSWISMYSGLPGRWSGVPSRALRRAASILFRQLQLAGRLPGLTRTRSAEINWLQQQLVPGRTSFVSLLRSPLIVDVDDAVWLKEPRSEQACATIARRSSAVIAGNAYLAEWHAQFAERVFVVPTAIDTDRFLPSQKKQEAFTIAWTGTVSNYPYLKTIESALVSFLADHRDARLLVIADRPPPLDGAPPGSLTYLKWSPEIEAPALAAAHVGIMPLPDDSWTRGKCSFKMLQYMSCAMPVVVSPVGTNSEILALTDAPLGVAAASDDQWRAAFELYYQDRDLASTHGASGRRVALQHFATPVVAKKVARVFDEVLRAN